MSNTHIHVTSGRTRSGVAITDTVFALLDSAKKDKDGLYVTVDGGNVPGLRVGRNRIYVKDETCIRSVAQGTAVASISNAVAHQTDEEIGAELIETFNILAEMTDAVACNVVRGLVVSGPAGIGKSHTIINTLGRSLDMLGRLNGLGSMYEVISGAMTAAVLYEKLWNYKEEGQVLVFDDCDSVLYDEDALNILKAALDSKKTRRVSWNARSNYLNNNDIPNSFDYSGGIIFITNVKFDQVRSQRIANHLEAITSRCHYMDIGVDTNRQKLIHIRNAVARNNMMQQYNFSDSEKQEVMDYIEANHDKLRELSLRMVLKISDLRRAMPHNWKKFAEKNCHKKAA